MHFFSQDLSWANPYIVCLRGDIPWIDVELTLFVSCVCHTYSYTESTGCHGHCGQWLLMTSRYLELYWPQYSFTAEGTLLTEVTDVHPIPLHGILSLQSRLWMNGAKGLWCSNTIRLLSTQLWIEGSMVLLSVYSIWIIITQCHVLHTCLWFSTYSKYNPM